MTIDRGLRLAVYTTIAFVGALALPHELHAKTIYEYGWSAKFWENHDVLVGKVVAVTSTATGYSVKCAVESSIRDSVKDDEVVELNYTSATWVNATLGPSKFERLKIEQRVLVLIERRDGKLQIPNGSGTPFYMMPKYSALYEIDDDDDVQFKETLALCRAISLSDQKAKLAALEEIQRNNPSPRLHKLLWVYFQESIYESKRNLKKSEDLGSRWKARQLEIAGPEGLPKRSAFGAGP